LYYPVARELGWARDLTREDNGDWGSSIYEIYVNKTCDIDSRCIMDMDFR